MSGSLTPGVNSPTIPPPIPPPGALTPAPTGLINSAPSVAPPPQTVGGATVTPYAPAAATAQTSSATGSTPNAFTVKPDQTVSGQISNIIASGSPLMQQAEANARNLMNERGLINSSPWMTCWR